MTAGESTCRLLEWDSQFFGMRIARLVQPRLSLVDWPDIAGECAAQRIDCLYFLVDAGDVDSIRSAEQGGFDCVDIRLTFEDAPVGRLELITPPSGDVTLRLFEEHDLPALQAIARVSYRDTRFYADPHFNPSRCDALYETWIEKSCHGRDDAVIVAVCDGRPVGFITCSLTARDGSIGLVGVAAEARGRSIGRLLVEAAQRWFQSHGAARVMVVTQGRNLAAQRLYQRCGFLTQSVQLWFHRWFEHEHDNA